MKDWLRSAKGFEPTFLCSNAAEGMDDGLAQVPEETMSLSNFRNS